MTEISELKMHFGDKDIRVGMKTIVVDQFVIGPVYLVASGALEFVAVCGYFSCILAKPARWISHKLARTGYNGHLPATGNCDHALHSVQPFVSMYPSPKPASESLLLDYLLPCPDKGG